MTISQELDLFVENLPKIPVSKRYWLIRTQSGSLYETFVVNKFIALDHNEVSISQLAEFSNNSAGDDLLLRKYIRNKVYEVHTNRLEEKGIFEELDTRKSTLISNQIFKFVYEIKKGDIVIIPSSNSDVISFGEVTESNIAEFSSEELRRSGTDAILKKRVHWIKDIARRNLDPYLYKMFTAHQALIDVGPYADIIERSLKDFFILDEEAHLIINVESEEEIPAPDLFGLGSSLLDLIDRFSKEYDLGISSKDLQVSISLNSPGKIDLKSRIKKTTLVSGLILAIFGGGYEDKDGTKFKTEGLPGLIRAISDFRDKEQQIEMRESIFGTYKDSLKVKNPDEMNKLMKQFSNNKDLPK